MKSNIFLGTYLVLTDAMLEWEIAVVRGFAASHWEIEPTSAR